MSRPSCSLHTKRTIDFFNERASTWGEKYSSSGSLRYRVELFLGALQERLSAGSCVLDFGCGTGDIAFACFTAGFRVVGCDISPGMINVARARYEKHGLEFYLFDREMSAHMPFDDCHFDAVIASSVLEYLSDPNAELAELGRVLQSEGWLLATLPNPRSPMRRAEAVVSGLSSAALLSHVAPVLPPKVRDLEKYLTLSINRCRLHEWQALFRQHGFQLEQIVRESGPLPMFVLRKIATSARG